MDIFEGDFHDELSSFDEILDFEETKFLKKSRHVIKEEAEEHYRSLDDY